MRRLPKSLSDNAFRSAWKYSRDSKSGNTPGAPGVDGIRASVFASNFMREIAAIRNEIREGSFQFNKLRFAPIPKPSGGYRIISIPTIRDRLLQRTILQALEADQRFNPNSGIAFGFRKGRKLSEAQLAARDLRNRNPWVLQVDIVKFFDQINRPKVEQLIRQSVRSKVVADLLCKAIHCEIEEVGGKGAEIIRDNGIERGKGLRQGMPVSPMLSNLLLKKFDNKLINRRLIALRYADDIAIFGNSYQMLLDAFAFMRASLDELDLKIPELNGDGKSLIRKPSESVEFLGVEVRRGHDGYILDAPFRKLTAIEADMAKIASVDDCVKNSRTFSQVIRTLDNFAIGHRASMAVIERPDEFMNRLESAKQRQISNLLSAIIGKKALKALDRDRRAILGLQPFG
jgi:RNA-directed DNA polymerase